MVRSLPSECEHLLLDMLLKIFRHVTIPEVSRWLRWGRTGHDVDRRQEREGSLICKCSALLSEMTFMVYPLTDPHLGVLDTVYDLSSHRGAANIFDRLEPCCAEWRCA